MKSGRTKACNLTSTWNAAHLASAIANWFRDGHRDLPWRRSKDPYRIWVSEIMLQQTTVTAVIPYFEKFMKRFPTVQSLAMAPLEEVLTFWSGLGYYSRARNLHKAAILFSQSGFPKTAHELENYPGLGPYTSRAVASIAFEQPVGVLDGNVSRVLSRVQNAKIEHWKPQGRAILQAWADELAAAEEPSVLNQSLMELGATICTPLNPTCWHCPWMKSCRALKAKTHLELPLKKPRRTVEYWIWKPQVLMIKQRLALVQNPDLPFLKGLWVFPGTIEQVKSRPKKFDLRHSITHHDIYIQLSDRPLTESKRVIKWVPLKNLKSINPSQLLQKVLKVQSIF